MALTHPIPATHGARERANEAVAAKQLNDAAEREHASQQLSEFGATFLGDLLEELRTQAAEFSAKVKDHRFWIYASTGPHGTGQTMLAFGEHAGTFFKPPADIVQLSEPGDQLVLRTYTSQVTFSERVLSWKVNENRIQILKKGEVQTLASFSAELIENFLKRFAR